MLKERVTRFKTLLETYANSNDNKLLLEAKLEKHNELWGEFNMIQKIDELLLESEVAERERGVRRCFFFQLQAAARSKLAQNTNSSANAQVNSQAINTIANRTPVRLLVMSLLTFSGNYKQ